MMRYCALLAAGALALGAAGVRAEDTTALPPLEQPTLVADGSAAAAPTSPQPVPPPVVSDGTPCNCCCAPSCGDHHAGCRRFWEWLTYCPEPTPGCGVAWQGNVLDTCHAFRAERSCGCGGDSSCGCGCTPCCQHVYVYFLDRCLPNFGYALPTPAVVGPIPSPTPLQGPPGGDCNPCGPGPYCHYPSGGCAPPPAHH
jgi:hypothetical protein